MYHQCLRCGYVATIATEAEIKADIRAYKSFFKILNNAARESGFLRSTKSQFTCCPRCDNNQFSTQIEDAHNGLFFVQKISLKK